MKNTARIACEIAEEASAIPMSYFRKTIDISTKQDSSPVTIADQKTEQFIREAIAKQFPEHGILGEEFGVAGDLDEHMWVIDPIDGTRSFITGSPMFGMLVGYLVRGNPQIGLIRMPALNETYVGIEGIGATCNDSAISCRNTELLSDALIYINEAERIMAMDPVLLQRLCTVGHTRRMNYDCYPHAMVASGRIDAVVDVGLEPYDYLPLVALIRAAGGVITDWNGQDLNMQSDGRILSAATPALHQELLRFLNH